MFMRAEKHAHEAYPHWDLSGISYLSTFINTQFLLAIILLPKLGAGI